MKSVIRTFCVCAIVCGVGSFLLLLLPLCWNEPINGQHYIAHAGGMIEGHRYTNSLEAVENAVRHGFKYIEVDLALTSDDSLVFLHDWVTFHKQTVGTEDNTPVSFEEYKSRLICGKFTPLTLHSLDSILASHKDVCIVTDKISDPAIINARFGHLKERLLIECFSFNDYLELRDCGYKLPMLSCFPTFSNVCKFSIKEMASGRFSVTPPMYVFGDLTYRSEDLCGFWEKNFGQRRAVFFGGVCTKEMADDIFQSDECVKFVYVDEVE